MFTLYLKQHNTTGMKYLGYTHLDDPHRYQGSGVYWKKHVAKHGYDVTTTVLKVCNTPEELTEWGLYFSVAFDVVHDPSFANLKEEAGIGGKYSSEVRAKMRASAKKRVVRDGPPKGAFTSEEATKRNKISWADPNTRSKRIKGIKNNRKVLSGWTHSEESRHRRKESNNKPPLNTGKKYTMKTVQCPHCGKFGSGGNMTRYHFENCGFLNRGVL